MAFALLKLAMVALSVTWRALETTSDESTATAVEVTNAKGHATPLASRLSRNEASAVSRTRTSALGRTKRCLYLAARASVAERFGGAHLAEEDVDCN